MQAARGADPGPGVRFRHLYALRAAVQAHAAGPACRGPGREVVLAVHELAANAIAHGAGHGHLRLWHLHRAPCELA